MNVYATKFVQLSKFTPEVVSIEAKSAIYFLKGLRYDIYDCVAMFRKTTYAEVLNHS